MSELMVLHKQIEVCTKCALSAQRTRAVPGAGDPEAQLMFVGEGPGFHEDRQGLPFVGAAGHLLDKLLASINMDRSDVFITNVVKCRPPGNRDPLPGEIAICTVYLDQQVELIKPKVIATLGRFSMAHFLGPGVVISQVHGQARKVGDYIVIPLFHPAAALRQERFNTALAEDFLKLPLLLAGTSTQAIPEAKPEPSVTTEPDQPTQLSLF